MRVEVQLDEDTTLLYVRWEVIPEGGESKRLEQLTGPLVLALHAENYVDTAGKSHDAAEVEIAIYPHAGRRNFGQARFTRHESRRAFVEHLQDAVIDEVATFVHEGDVEHVPLDGHVIRVGASAT